MKATMFSVGDKHKDQGTRILVTDAVANLEWGMGNGGRGK